MKLFDLHCDTLLECLTKGKSLFQNDLQLSVERGLAYFPWVQCFAVFIPDNKRGESASRLFDDAADLLEREASLHPEIVLVRDRKQIDRLSQGQCGAILTVESGAAMRGSLEQLRHLHRRGVRMITLTWNGVNELGGGVRAPGTLTAFGREAVREMERLSIAIDLSHASERLFYAVAEQTSGPLVASHSDSRTLCSHPRNLTDEQFCLIRDRSGLVGLNFCPNFLRNGGNAGIEDLYRHAEHFLSLGGEDVLAMGSDFDGTPLPNGISGVQSMEKIAAFFSRQGCSEELIQKIFFENACQFFRKL